MPEKQKVLVVGTTTDYIDLIRRACPDRALFLTDPRIRRQGREPQPAPAEEILCDLADTGQVRLSLKEHLRQWDLELNGISCFDCESMELAAILASDYALSYPGVQTIRACRDKHLCKDLWIQNKVSCPRARLLSSAAEACDFQRQLARPCVLKPCSGSGSELVFKCLSQEDCQSAVDSILYGLGARQENRLYAAAGNPILAEELIQGIEYSCDFVIDNERLELIRLTRKIHAPEAPFGTIRGYILCSSPPAGIEQNVFEQTLYASAKALGIERAVCMLDFLVREQEMFLLEIAPRPGGDCLPFLLKCARGLDILTLTLDLAQQRPLQLSLDVAQKQESCIGLRLHAKRSGVLRKIDTREVRRDPRLREVHIIRNPGHMIRMPPEDYDSWLLGHIIFQPWPDIDPERQCDEFTELLGVEIS